jgi:hypothetical protein
VKTERKDLPDQKVKTALQALRVRKDCRARLALQEIREIREIQALRALRERLAQLAQRDRVVLKDLPGRQDLSGRKDRRV